MLISVCTPFNIYIANPIALGLIGEKNNLLYFGWNVLYKSKKSIFGQIDTLHLSK